MYPDDIRGVYEESSALPYYLVGLFVSTLIVALLINTVQSAFQRISPDLQSLTPAQLWITVIPFFGSIWIFYVIWHLANALSEEFKRRKIVEFETFPGLGVGWAYAFFTVTAQLTLLIDETTITVLLYIVSFILLIIYWTKIAAFNNKLNYDSLGANQFHSPPPFQSQWQQHAQHNRPESQIPQQPPAQSPQQGEWERWKPK